MSSSLRRGALAAAVAFSMASLAACAAGGNAQTLEVKPDNAAATVGDIKVQNALVITQPDLEAAGPAAISATVFNNGDTAQTLDSITVADGGESAELKPAEGSGKLTVPAGGYIILGGKGNAAAVLAGGSDAITDGNAQKITFNFSQTGDVSLRAFVVPSESYFTGWGPSAVPSAPGSSTGTTAPASPEPSGSASASASTSESPAGSVSGTPTDAASASVSAAVN